jgi:Taurine catabolism dioxygenase TauD, TfdA family
VRRAPGRSRGAARFAAIHGALRGELARDPRFQLRIKLEACMMSAFDNRRVLHGRAAFDETDRRLCPVARRSVPRLPDSMRRAATIGSIENTQPLLSLTGDG